MKNCWVGVNQQSLTLDWLLFHVSKNVSRRLAYQRIVWLGDTSGERTAKPSEEPEFWWDSCCSICSFLCGILWIVVCRFPFDRHCVVCPSVYELSLPLWYRLMTYYFKHSYFTHLLTKVNYFRLLEIYE